ncbi:hypothetical protein [Methylobacterium sp. WL116]|uniref:hypothetical protein n=1 Tax=Methylobacterium sp. WL116 TaxID=2603889 RepID=UPI0011C8A589|nr:hypothetical protein [Methylobacterium sp. WL116]TXM92632.1 hypothetical protein FV223_11135 [Methylobacterium sp. WL116]
MITTRRWGEPIPDDGITFEQLRPHGWAPGKYCAPCRTCRETHWDCDKRARSCRPCAVKALKAERAKPPASAQTGPEPTDAQVVAFGDAFYGNLTQWGYSERQRNGLAEDVRRGLRAALALGVAAPSPTADLEAIYQAGFDAAPVEGVFRTDVDPDRMRADIASLVGGAS